MLNKVILIGRLANEPELKWTPSGIPVTTFRLAVERPMSAEARQSGQEKQADFIDIVAWRQQAEFASNYLGKGRLVSIEGRLHVRQYQAADGTNRRQCEVVVEQLKSLERPRESTPGAESFDHGNREPVTREPEVNGYTRSPAPETSVRRTPPPAASQPYAAGRSSSYSAPPPKPAVEPAADVDHDPFTDDFDDPFA